ncbi:Protein of unknown function DUF674 [Dillenia turbinata]|uniref:Uncharacterized protein n=1 Tax=Dillenia turbinata TaxID=194707 RepID=A0AAN8VK91_9MAGN
MIYEVCYVPPPSLAASSPSSSGEGYVKVAVIYMVMDDLTVKPVSSISSITVFKKFNVKDIGALEEKKVKLIMAEVLRRGLKLLSEAFLSKDALTNVFPGERSSLINLPVKPFNTE